MYEELGLKQLSKYLDRSGLGEGWLALFDMRKRRWDKKIFVREVEYGGKTIRIVGC